MNVFLSPHLDDAVLSCGHTLYHESSSTIVATAFAADPRHDLVTKYDVDCGFDGALQAMAARREEDRLACTLLGVQPVHGPFVQSAYGVKAGVIALAEWISELLVGDEARLFAPLGIVHDDHIAIRRAIATLAPRLSGRLVVYEEIPYRVLAPEHAAEAIAEAEFTATLYDPNVQHTPAKAAAIACYGSQRIDPAWAVVNERYRWVSAK